MWIGSRENLGRETQVNHVRHVGHVDRLYTEFVAGDSGRSCRLCKSSRVMSIGSREDLGLGDSYRSCRSCRSCQSCRLILEIICGGKLMCVMWVMAVMSKGSREYLRQKTLVGHVGHVCRVGHVERL